MSGRISKRFNQVYPQLIFVLLIGLSAAQFSGCSRILGNLRRDLDDSDAYTPPTVGGAWAERGLLSDEDPGASMDRYSAVGHSERNPASVGSGVGAGADRYSSRLRSAQPQPDAAALGNDGPVMDGATKAAEIFKNGTSRATKQDFVDDAPNEGSLWASDGQTNYYFTKNKIRGVGDIITISAEEGMVKDLAAEVARTLSKGEKMAEIQLAQDRLRAKALGLPSPDGPATKDAVTGSAAGPNRQVAGDAGTLAGTSAAAAASGAEPDVRDATAADIDVAKSLGIKAGDTMMAEIVERYPNGNYKVRGVKKVPYRTASRYVQIAAIARSSDITEEDTIPSGKLYEYRLEATK